MGEAMNEPHFSQSPRRQWEDGDTVTLTVGEKTATITLTGTPEEARAMVESALEKANVALTPTASRTRT